MEHKKGYSPEIRDRLHNAKQILFVLACIAFLIGIAIWQPLADSGIGINIALGFVCIIAVGALPLKMLFGAPHAEWVGIWERRVLPGPDPVPRLARYILKLSPWDELENAILRHEK